MKNTEKKNTAKTYKQIIEAMSQIKTEDDYNRVCGEISNSFSREKITWKDYEILHQLAAMASVTVI